MLAKVYSGQVLGLTPRVIDVEIDISNGLHSFSIIGLPDKAIEEAKDRISAAIKNSQIKSPKKGNKKIVVSLAPADIKKEGTLYDLAIALSYLKATNEINFDPDKKLFIGELSLNGNLRPIRGSLFITKMAKDLGFEEIYMPKENTTESSLVKGIKIYGVTNLSEIIKHLNQEDEFKIKTNNQKENRGEKRILTDFSYIREQESVKRALLISASGGHNVAMYGPPGTGKTMLAKAFSGIIPELNLEQKIETTGIHSVAGILKDGVIANAPFRAPHHTSSFVSIVGGGAYPKPGEITLAHNGVLFLDEFPEFDRRVIEALREPLEEKCINIARSKGNVNFPANFILIAAMNPCPCGKKDVKDLICTCMPSDIERYKRKLSGPIVDRIDIWIDVPRVSFEKMTDERTGKSSTKFIEKVKIAREIQKSRFHNSKTKLNSQMNVEGIEKYINLNEKMKRLLNESAEKLKISARSYHKIIKVAQTIADLEQSSEIKETHILEALSYRPKVF